MPSPTQLAVLLSGGGRTLQNLADSIGRGELDAKIGRVISSHADAYGLQRAAGLGIATHTVRPKDHPDTESFSAELFREIRECRPDLVCLAGWLCLIRVPDDYTGDVMSDLNTRRARIQGMETEGANQKVVAQAPEAELLRYSTKLRSLTQGRGIHSARFKQYEPMPKHVQEHIAASAVEAPKESSR